MCKVTKAEVEIAVEHALEDYEVERGLPPELPKLSAERHGFFITTTIH